MLHAQDTAFFTQSARPQWVSEWLVKREEKAQKQKEKKEQPAEPIDPEVAEKSARQRWTRIEAAGVDLQRWLVDQIDRGLAALNGAQRDEWQTVSARLIDAQAPGLAERVRAAGEAIGVGEAWPENVLRQFGMLQLLCDALSRRESLSPALQADLRAALGWPTNRAEVMQSGEPVKDRWIVLGQAHDERGNKLHERRVWLQGATTGRRALILDHAYGSASFEQMWHMGTAVDATCIFFAGAAGLRALATDCQAPSSVEWPRTSIAGEWQTMAVRVAKCAWLDEHPLLFCDAVIERRDSINVLIADGQAVPLELSEADAWQFLALSGGHPIACMGEWRGDRLMPLAAQGADGMWQRSAV
jgi:hypothetical protein